MTKDKRRKTKVRPWSFVIRRVYTIKYCQISNKLSRVGVKRGVGAGVLPPGSIGLISNPSNSPHANAQHAARINTAMTMIIRLTGRAGSETDWGSYPYPAGWVYAYGAV
jgi:hypothetical protein